MATNTKSRLVDINGVKQLEVDGRPWLILGGELGNSSASAPQDVAKIFPRLKELGLNTVLVPAYWDLIEPEEGEFDFTTTDAVIDEAEKNDLKVVFLWFGSWKNSMSCYAPEWFKKDWKKYPRARTKEGKPLEIASAFSENVFRADSTAFTRWLRHTIDRDKNGTVIMLQIENEIGMLEDARDHSPLADREYANGVRQTDRHLAKPQYAASGYAQGLGIQRQPQVGQLGGSVRTGHIHRRILHDMELCEIRRTARPRRQGNHRHATLRQRRHEQPRPKAGEYPSADHSRT